jgi:hypothetical protein
MVRVGASQLHPRPPVRWPPRPTPSRAPNFHHLRRRYRPFFIIPVGGRFEVRFEDEVLGSYYSLASALDNLLSGQVDWPSTGLDPSKADLPDDIGQWTFVGR